MTSLSRLLIKFILLKSYNPGIKTCFLQTLAAKIFLSKNAKNYPTLNNPMPIFVFRVFLTTTVPFNQKSNLFIYAERVHIVGALFPADVVPEIEKIYFDRRDSAAFTQMQVSTKTKLPCELPTLIRMRAGCRESARPISISYRSTVDGESSPIWLREDLLILVLFFWNKRST